MRRFSDLYEALDGTNSTNEKVHLMRGFFRAEDHETVAWAVYFLSGRTTKKNIGSAKLRRWAQELSGIPDWLLEDCYGAVGDTSEMVSLILASQAPAVTEQQNKSLGEWMREEILPVLKLDEQQQKRKIVSLWRQLSRSDIFVLNKFLTGGLRVGVSETLVYRALAEATGLPRPVIAARLIGRWEPSAEFAAKLFRPVDEELDVVEAVTPKPFCLAAPVENDVQQLGPVSDWQIEWKWDGIRCQAVKAGDHVELWSRGEDRITDAFPDFALVLKGVPGNWILDGELVAHDWNKPASFNTLQRRLNRKSPSKKLMTETSVAFIAYDLLQLNGEDLRERPLSERRARLEKLLNDWPEKSIGPSELLKLESWDEAARLRETSRERGAEGLMLKKKTAPYVVGRKRGIWFKWKVDPLTVDAVLTAAQPGTGKRASLYTDYTFSIWKEEKLVPIAKAYSGLTDAEIRSLDNWIRRHTLERHGPVRILEPMRVFEIGFEGIGESKRHKSGYALRFPRILRERTDKPAKQADRVQDLAPLVGAPP